MVLTDTGLAKVFQRIKSFVIAQLNSKASAIHTHTSSDITDLSNGYVSLTGAQTIGGIKTFSDIPIVVNSKTYTSQISADRINGKKSDFSANNGFKIICNQNSDVWGNTAFAIHLTDYTPTTGQINFKLYDCIENGTSYKGFFFKKDDNNFQLSPTASNSTDLGTSTNKWKSFNGVNPGALSLPSNSYTNVDTTNWDLTCSNGQLGSFTPTADGWLMLHIANSGSSEANFWVIGGVIRINNKSSICNTTTDNFNMFTIPVEKDVTYNIYGNASEYVAGRSIRYCRFMPCRGNI